LLNQICAADLAVVCEMLGLAAAIDGPLAARSGVTIDGTCKVGANFAVVALHPMKYGATLMSSFLFNVALVRPRFAPFVPSKTSMPCRDIFARKHLYRSIA